MSGQMAKMAGTTTRRWRQQTIPLNSTFWMAVDTSATTPVDFVSAIEKGPN
jgi:hypothetical protein